MGFSEHSHTKTKIDNFICLHFFCVWNNFTDEIYFLVYLLENLYLFCVDSFMAINVEIHIITKSRSRLNANASI